MAKRKKKRAPRPICCPKNAEVAMHSVSTGKRYRHATCITKKTGKPVKRLKHCRPGQKPRTSAGTLWKAGPSASKVSTYRTRSVGSLGCGCGG